VVRGGTVDYTLVAECAGHLTIWYSGTTTGMFWVHDQTPHHEKQAALLRTRPFGQTTEWSPTHSVRASKSQECTQYQNEAIGRWETRW
jgi:hypothetical protein